MTSSWIPHGIRSSMRVSSVLASVRRRKLWRSLQKRWKRAKERENERERENSLLVPARFSTSYTSSSLTRSHPPMTRQSRCGSRTARDNEETFSSCRTDAPWTSSLSVCTILLFPCFFSHRCCLPRCRFSSGLHGGVICRHRDDDTTTMAKVNYMRESRSTRHAKCAMTFTNSQKSAFALPEKDLLIFFLSCWFVQ